MHLRPRFNQLETAGLDETLFCDSINFLVPRH